jgi:hypothetical protein
VTKSVEGGKSYFGQTRRIEKKINIMPTLKDFNKLK